MENDEVAREALKLRYDLLEKENESRIIDKKVSDLVEVKVDSNMRDIILVYIFLYIYFVGPTLAMLYMILG